MLTSKSNPPTANPFEKLNLFLPLLWISLAFLAGIVAGRQVQASTWAWVLAMTAAFGLALLTRLLLPRLGERFSRLPLAIFFITAMALAAFFAGGARFRSTIPKVDAHYIAWYKDRGYELLVTGTVADPPDVRDTYTNLRLQVTNVDTGDETLDVHGLILVRTTNDRQWQYGDVVRVRGRLQTPPSNEDFSYRDFLARQGILAYIPNAETTLLPFTDGDATLRLIYAFKDKANTNIHKIFPEPEASLLAGILLGDDNGITEELQQAYKNTGTAHIIAISGFNIAIIAALFVALFSRILGKRKGAIAAVVGIVIYTILVGASASVVRAAIMGALGIFATQMGRRQNGLNTLAFTAAVMTLVNPNALWDVGFQLSFAATLGLILFAAPLQNWFMGLLQRRLPPGTATRIANLVGGYLLFTLAAQITTLPVMAYQFGRISLVSLIANPLVLPAQPLVMVLGGLALILSGFYLPLGKAAAWLAWPFAAYTNRMVEFFNRLPNSVITLGEFSLLFVALFYIIMILLVFAGVRLKGKLRPLLTPAVLLTLLGIFTYLFWAAALAAPDGNLHLTFLDAGSADAILIQTPSGHHLLVNGGESTSALASALGQRFSPFDRKLDWLIVASPQEKQVAALPRLLELMPPKNVLWAGNTNASFSAEAAERWLIANNTPITPAYSGAELDLGEGARLVVLNASARGAVLLVEWKGFRALLPMGVNFDVLNQLGNGKSIGPVTALLLADSGFDQSNPPEWLANLKPQLIVLSVKAADPDGLPDAAVLEQAGDGNLLRTDQNGWIEITTDGQGFWVEVEKK